MKRRAVITLAAAALVMLSLGSCRERSIPASKLSRIYADMLMADQWFASNPAEKDVADTSLVYEPIFRKYGYTTEDFNRTVSHYLYNPEKYRRIMVDAQEILQKRLDKLKEQEDECLERELFSDPSRAVD